MGETVDIGRRIELVPMDSHFHDITIGLYCQERDEEPAFLVHTYSRLEGAKRRIAFVRKAMKILGGMELTSDGLLRFPCWAEHELACKRIFLEACKLDPDEPNRTTPFEYSRQEVWSNHHSPQYRGTGFTRSQLMAREATRKSAFLPLVGG